MFAPRLSERFSKRSIQATKFLGRALFHPPKPAFNPLLITYLANGCAKARCQFEIQTASAATALALVLAPRMHPLPVENLWERG